ncbi:hypothetical protein GO496_18815 [Acidovorax citrulli]|nr:hypothetical protein [Paracidovorax citrulli]MVT37983.1 hypothetical protein [Paracidovorax citrulli]
MTFLRRADAPRQQVRSWSGLGRPLRLNNGVGGAPLAWAFAGLEKSEVENKYLDGKQVFIA